MIVCAGSITADSSDIRYDCKTRVAELATDWRSGQRYITGMQIPPLSQWVRGAVAKVGSQAELARLISKELRREIDRAAVNKMCLGTRAVGADEMLAMEAVSGTPVPSPNVPAPVPLLSWVSAGKLSDADSQIPVEDVPLLAFADLGRGDFFALKVVGDSMDRHSPEGSIIVVNRAERELLPDKPYVFWHRTMGTTYKLWQPKPPRLEPYSWNAANKPIFVERKRDFGVIGRVRRTVLDL